MSTAFNIHNTCVSLNFDLVILRSSFLSSPIRPRTLFSAGTNLRDAYTRPSNSGIIYAPQNVERLETAFNEEIAGMLKDGFTPEEIADAKKGYLQSRQVGRSQDWSLVRKLANYAFLGRTFKWDAEFERKLTELTPEQVTAAMRRHIDPSKVTIIKAGDLKKVEAKVISP